jgi:hypothetical protein
MASGSRLRRQRRAQYADSEETSGPFLRNTHYRPNYVVDNSSDSEDVEFAQSDLTMAEPPARRIPTTSHLAKRKALSRAKPYYTSYKRQKILGAPLRRKQPSDSASVLPFARPGGKVPPWQSLEHSILTEILRFASHPLYSDYLNPTASIRWLIEISYLSKSFHDAAISAMMFCPPLVNGM